MKLAKLTLVGLALMAVNVVSAQAEVKKETSTELEKKPATEQKQTLEVKRVGNTPVAKSQIQRTTVQRKPEAEVNKEKVATENK
ncbi:MAG: hypothetical protein R2779_10720 [Crocinitomicaceae bacterium]|nr:hypothetical protein [Taishania sp.]